MTFIGRVSYSWYLWHWPLLAFTRLLYLGDLPLHASIPAIAIAFAIAVLSYFFVEQPCRKSPLAARPLLLRYAVVSIFILLVCAGIWLSGGVPQRFPEFAQVRAQRNQLSLLRDPCLVRENIDLPNRSQACYEASPLPAVALWGDSHAAALAPGLRDSVHAQHLSFVQFTRTGCLPLVGASLYLPKTPLEQSVCVRYNQNALSSLAADHHIRTVILAGFWEGPFRPEFYGDWLVRASDLSHDQLGLDASRRLMERSLAAAVQGLHDAGKQVIVVENTPVFAFDPILRVEAPKISLRRNLARLVGVQNFDDPGFAPRENVKMDALLTPLLQEATTGLPGVTLLDLKPELCITSAECTYRVGDQVLYGDPHHLFPSGARYAFRNFRLPPLAPAPTTRPE
jgi:hypothetical protein